MRGRTAGFLQLGRHVARERDDATRRTLAEHGRAVGHWRTLRKPEKYERVGASRDIVDDAIDVGEIVQNHLLAILACHPAGHHALVTTAVKPAQRLRRRDMPPIDPWYFHHVRQHLVGTLAVPVEGHEPSRRVAWS